MVHDVELKFTPGKGTAVATFSIACKRQFKQEGQDDVDFFSIVVWGKLAEVCSQYLVKGQYANVRGRIQNRKYRNKNDIDVHITEIIADTIDFLEKPRGSAEGNTNFNKSSKENFNSYQEDSGVTPLEDGETPF